MCVNLLGLRDAKIAGKTFFLAASVKRLALEWVDWVKKMALTNAGGHHPVESLNRTKKQRKGRFALLASSETSIFSCP